MSWESNRDFSVSCVLPPIPQVGLGHLVQRHIPVSPQSSPGKRSAWREVAAYCDSVVMVRLRSYLERLGSFASPNCEVPAAARPAPPPLTGLEEMKGTAVRWRFFGSATSPAGAGFFQPSFSISQVGRSVVVAEAAGCRATSMRPGVADPLPAARFPVEPGSPMLGR